MSETEAPPLLTPQRTAFVTLHQESCALAKQVQRHMPWETSRIYGLRGLYRPNMATRTMARMGPVRHALAQRAIAGTLEVHAPFAPALSDEAVELVTKTDARRATTLKSKS